MNRKQPIIVLYRIKKALKQSNSLKQQFPNAFFTYCQSYPPKVRQIRKAFPWGQLQQPQSGCSDIDLIKKQWTMRFGVNSSGNDGLNCEIWLDLKDQDSIPMVEENKAFVQVQKGLKH